MLLQEFEKLTGIYVTVQMYKHIENAYTEFDGDKTAFCKAYKSNKDGIAEHVQILANEEMNNQEREFENKLEEERTKSYQAGWCNGKDSMNPYIELKDDEIKRLKDQLKVKEHFLLTIKTKAGCGFTFTSENIWKIMTALDSAATEFNFDVDREAVMITLVDMLSGNKTKTECCKWSVEKVKAQ